MAFRAVGISNGTTIGLETYATKVLPVGGASDFWALCALRPDILQHSAVLPSLGVFGMVKQPRLQQQELAVGTACAVI